MLLSGSQPFTLIRFFFFVGLRQAPAPLVILHRLKSFIFLFLLAIFNTYTTNGSSLSQSLRILCLLFCCAHPYGPYPYQNEFVSSEISCLSQFLQQLESTVVLAYLPAGFCIELHQHCKSKGSPNCCAQLKCFGQCLQFTL